MFGEEFEWVEKWRPHTVDDCILPESYKATFREWVKNGVVQNCTLTGGPGIGKTTVAKAMLDEIGADYFVVNGSMNGNIDTLRNEIATFASSVSLQGGRKYVIIDEADGLNPTSFQPALRGFIEEFSNNCFHRNTKIMTIEYGAKEIGSLLNKEVTVKSADGVWRKVNIKSYGKQDLYKISFGKFNSTIKHVHQDVIVTKNHRWFLEDGSETTKLTIGDKLKHIPYDYNNKGNLEGIIHGMIFGDGSGHKHYIQTGTIIARQGKYASIRLCKQDKFQQEMFDYFIEAGYVPNYPSHCNGDPIFYMGYIPYVKDLPFTNDPNYIKGFIYGWWLADGKKDRLDRFLISSIRKDAIDWLVDYASYAGLVVTGLNITKGDYEGRFKNGKDLYNITLNPNYTPSVRNIEYYGNDEVFCLEEPVSTGFFLANGLMTGNCGFILTCNYLNKLIGALHSRCPVIEFKINKADKQKIATDFFKRVCYILKEENIEFDKSVVAQVIQKYFPDFRETIGHLQRYAASGKIDSGILTDLHSVSLKELVEHLKKKDFTNVRKWVADNSDADSSTIFRRFYETASEFFTKASIPALVLIIGKYQYQASFVADPEINISAFCIEVMLETEFV